MPTCSEKTKRFSAGACSLLTTIVNPSPNLNFAGAVGTAGAAAVLHGDSGDGRGGGQLRAGGAPAAALLSRAVDPGRWARPGQGSLGGRLRRAPPGRRRLLCGRPRAPGARGEQTRTFHLAATARGEHKTAEKSHRASSQTALGHGQRAGHTPCSFVWSTLLSWLVHPR